MLRDKWPIINFGQIKNQTLPNTWWSLFLDNIQCGRIFICKHAYWNQLHWRVFYKYLPYRKTSQTTSFKTVCYFSARLSDKLALATASAQQKEGWHDNNETRGSDTKTTVKLRAAKQTSIKPNGMEKVLFASKWQGLKFLEQYEHLAQQEQLMFAQGMMEVLSNRLFYTLIVK